MRLILIRHADAAPPIAGQADAERPLSTVGKEQAQQLARFLHRQQLCPSLLLCSPYQRARQTAEPLQRICGSEIWMDSALTPTSNVEDAYTLLIQFQSFPILGCITHQPLIGHLAATLLRCSSLPIAIPPATALIFELRRQSSYPAATLLGLYPPAAIL